MSEVSGRTPDAEKGMAPQEQGRPPPLRAALLLLGVGGKKKGPFLDLLVLWVADEGKPVRVGAWMLVLIDE